MDRLTEAGLTFFAVLGFVAWLGGGRKWAFRTLLSLLVLAAIGAAGILLYNYETDKDVERRAQKLHECAVAKIADPKCEEAPKGTDSPKGSLICPAYTLPDNASSQEEEAALAAAEQECRAEPDPKQKSLHEQLIGYRHQHGIAESVPKLSAKDCAEKLRSFYPRVYDDLNDATLTKKVLAKYPEYCDLKNASSFVPEVEGIR